MSDSATPPPLATRDALAKALWLHVFDGDPAWGWENLRAEDRAAHAAQADALLASGVVRDVSTLADDEALVDAIEARYFDNDEPINDTLRAFAAALTEDPS